MFEELSADELQLREGVIFLNLLSRKTALETAGLAPQHRRRTRPEPYRHQRSLQPARYVA